MKSIRLRLGCAALALAAAVAIPLSGCGTGSVTTDSAASTPASTHFKADLATGYTAIQAVRVGTTSALQSHVITVAQAEAVQTQCKAFTATLDSLRAAGDSTNSQTALTATLAAIQAATIFITASQGVPKS